MIEPASVPLSAATRVVGVIGDPVAHSLSPRLHNAAFRAMGLDWVSVGFRVDASSTAAAIAGAPALGIQGLSVTMPHKEAVASLVACTPAAQRLASVNCVTFGPNGAEGDTTDGAGLLAALFRQSGFVASGKRVFVVGTGGAARAITAAFGDAGAAEVLVLGRNADRVSRTAAMAGAVGRPARAEEVTGCELVVNATPIGMAGQPTDGITWPVDPGLVTPDQLAVDLIYHPVRTPWLAALADQGVPVMNGIGMLVHQAALALERWTGEVVPVEAMWAAVADPSDPGPSV